jgi:membrane glycosyltransferase
VAGAVSVAAMRTVPVPSPSEERRQRLARAIGPAARDLVFEDRQGNVRIVTMPPMRRATMAPTPWRQKKGDSPYFRQPAADAEPSSTKIGTVPAGTVPEPWRGAAHRRRALFLLLVAAQTLVATVLAQAVLPYHGRHWLEPPLLLLNGILIAWVSAGFWMALMGFWVRIRGGDRHALRPLPGSPPLPAGARTAIVVPIFNENVRRVFAGVQATYESLRQTGRLANFDFYVLSDSSDPDARVDELAAWAGLCRAVGGFRRIFYRHRRLRIKRKSGNIADWCRRWGRYYRYMVVLDADSVMSGACLTQLVRMMEANPAAGIIQTVAMPTGRDTLYARIQQFAHRVYAPLFTAGIHFWHLGEAYYWGHNAIIRVEPFIRHCALPRLPARGPLGGELLSHDFVEAALMRRAGWHVWIAYTLPGSWEEMPPTLLEELRRDRRWCHGNLQHSRLFLAQGLHPAHRALFMAGVMTYVSALLWFAYLALCTALLAVHVLVPPVYFTQPFQLYPLWPEWRPHWAIALFGATAALLLLPKILATLLLTLGGAQGFGGRLAVIAGVLLEIVFSTLLAPIRMIFHARFVVGALLDLSPKWHSPPREDVETTWREALARHGAGTVLGVAWIAFATWLNPAFLPWLLPVAGSLIAAIPVSVWSSRIRAGKAFRRMRLFLTPEESSSPPELARVRALMAAPAGPQGVAAARADPQLNALVLAADPRRWRVAVPAL